MMARVVAVVLLACCSPAWSSLATSRSVSVGSARFSVLSPRVNRPSLVFTSRDAIPTPSYTVRYLPDGRFELSTEYLTIRYTPGAPFSSQSLEGDVVRGDATSHWSFGQVDPLNLNGPGTHDDYARLMSPGILSRSGWAVVQDTATPLLSDAPWPWVMPRPLVSELVDVYLFGCGLEFTACLGDFASLAGRPSLPPPAFIGVWWSNSRSYTQHELVLDVLDGYLEREIPLNLVSVDMGWHDQPKGDPLCDPWGGYTWNTTLWPDPPALAKFARDHGWSLLLNIHTQTGVDHCDANYSAMAHLMGVDPATKAVIPCNCTDPVYVDAFFETMLDPNPAVDYWWTDTPGCGWLDWQLNVWYSNYVFFTRRERSGRRPAILSRYGGLGNHRHPVGFSGDAFSAWSTLEYEVWMTPQAGNVLYGWWSHDIGGFHGPDEENAEQYARCERRVWVFAEPWATAMIEAMNLRSMLGPYIYTSGREFYDTGVSLLRPMYYSHPAIEEAYEFSHTQYMFGPSLLCAPVTAPSSSPTNSTAVRVWLPPGDSWASLLTGEAVAGGTVLRVDVGPRDIPVWARVGSVIPTRPVSLHTESNPPEIWWVAFPGEVSEGVGVLYEDAGSDMAYVDGVFSNQTAHLNVAHRNATLRVGARAGSFPSAPQTRRHVVEFRGWPLAGNVTHATVNGRAVDHFQHPPAGEGWWVVGSSLFVGSDAVAAGGSVTLSAAS